MKNRTSSSKIRFTFILEGTINIHIEKLPEGIYLATSEDIQGLVAQGTTITGTMEIARDICKKLIEFQNLKSKLRCI